MLIANKARNKENESKVEKDLQTMDKSIQQLKTDHSKLIEKETNVTNKLQSLNNQFKERTEILSKRIEIRKIYQKKQTNIQNLKDKEKDVMQRLSSQQEESEVKLQRLNELKKQNIQLDQMKLANNEYEQTIFNPSKDLYPKLLEEKQALAQSITELHDRSITDKNEFDKTKQANDVVIKNLSAELEEKLEIIESKKKEIVEMETAILENRTCAKDEIEEQETLISNLDQAMRAQKIQNDQVLKQRQDVKAAYFKWSNKVDPERFEIKVLKKGAEIITGTKKEEDDLKLSTKIELDAIKKVIKEKTN